MITMKIKLIKAYFLVGGYMYNLGQLLIWIPGLSLHFTPTTCGSIQSTTGSLIKGQSSMGCEKSAVDVLIIDDLLASHGPHWIQEQWINNYCFLLFLMFSPQNIAQALFPPNLMKWTSFKGEDFQTTNPSYDCIFHYNSCTSSMLSHCPVLLHLLFLHHQKFSQNQPLLICRQKTVER